MPDVWRWARDQPEPDPTLIGKEIGALPTLDYIDVDVSGLVDGVMIPDDAELDIRVSVQVNGETLAEGSEKCSGANKHGDAVNTVVKVKEQFEKAIATR